MNGTQQAGDTENEAEEPLSQAVFEKHAAK